jgi:hypothetical protein
MIKAAERGINPGSFELGLQFISIDPKQQTLLKQYAAINALPPLEGFGAAG